MPNIDTKTLIEHLEVETENLVETILFEATESPEGDMIWTSGCAISTEEGRLTEKQWLEKLEMVHNEIAASIHRYKESL